MNKFTFKIHERTGRYRTFQAKYCDIKLLGKKVGGIQEITNLYSNNDENVGKFRIGFMVWKKDIMEDKNPNCEWKWIWLKYKPSSIQEAKDFIIKYSEDIQKRFNLYIREE